MGNIVLVFYKDDVVRGQVITESKAEREAWTKAIACLQKESSQKS